MIYSWSDEEWNNQYKEWIEAKQQREICLRECSLTYPCNCGMKYCSEHGKGNFVEYTYSLQTRKGNYCIWCTNNHGLNPYAPINRTCLELYAPSRIK